MARRIGSARIAEITVAAVLVLGPPAVGFARVYAVPLAETVAGAAGPDPLGGWGDLAKTFGITALCLFALAVAVWRAAVWAGNRILVPIAERHVKFVDEVAASAKAQVEVLRALADAQKAQAEAARTQTDVQRVQVEQIQAHTRLIQTMEQNVLAQLDSVRRLIVHADSVVISPEHGHTGGGPKGAASDPDR